ncbi:MAG: hypothetical protein N3C59_07840, partial [Azovibrio sp.]|nr:hypothetical protein [Azovibrio sp.]
MFAVEIWVRLWLGFPSRISQRIGVEGRFYDAGAIRVVGKSTNVAVIHRTLPPILSGLRLLNFSRAFLFLCLPW